MPAVGKAVVDVLEHLGHSIVYHKQQTCCGQPAFNGGYFDEARNVARHMLDLFERDEVVVVPSGSCAAMVKTFYPSLFENTPDETRAKELAAKTWEFSDFLATRLGVTDLGASFNHTVTIHDGCHGVRELGIADQPRKLLSHVRGLKLVEMSERKTCCGFGGTFAVKFPQVSVAMTQVKCASILETNAEFVVSNDPSCLLQIRGYMEKTGRTVPTLHLAEVLCRR